MLLEIQNLPKLRNIDITTITHNVPTDKFLGLS